MYSYRNLWKQEPAAISAFVVAAFNQMILIGVVNWSGEVIAGINTLTVLLLGLFYSRPLTTSKDALKELTDADSRSKAR